MIHTIGELLVGLMESIAFFIVIDALFTRRDNIPSYLYGGAIVFIAAVIDISFYMLFGTMQNFAIMYIAVFLLTCMYIGEVKTKLILPLILITLNAVSELPVLFLTTYIFDVTVEMVIENKILWLFGAFFSKVVLLLFANFFRLRLKNKKMLLKTSYWLMFVVVFFPSILTSFLLFRLTYNVTEDWIRNLSILASIGIMSAAFASIFLYEHLSRQTESENRERLYAQHIKSQSKHLDEILVMQNQLKSFRHDIKNHYIALAGYFENGDLEGGKNYIDKINGEITKKEVVDTGNTALDAIISTKKALAEEKGITFESTVQIPEQLPVDAADICIVFGNSLDNAIEACEKIQKGEKKIHLSVIYEDDSILCKIVNSIETEKKITLKSTKKDKKNHGFGIENIKQALSKYNHVIKMDQTDKEFVFSFIIFNK